MTNKTKKRLARLALYILNEKKRKFDMGSYQTIDDSIPDKHNSCATSCCALGYAPFIFSSLREKPWNQVFFELIEIDYLNDYSHHPIFIILFSARWPNERESFAARVLKLIKTGELSVESYYNLNFSSEDKEELKQIYENPESF